MRRTLRRRSGHHELPHSASSGCRSSRQGGPGPVCPSGVRERATGVVGVERGRPGLVCAGQGRQLDADRDVLELVRSMLCIGDRNGAVVEDWQDATCLPSDSLPGYLRA
jgi:hypothetical protein